MINTFTADANRQPKRARAEGRKLHCGLQLMGRLGNIWSGVCQETAGGCTNAIASVGSPSRELSGGFFTGSSPEFSIARTKTTDQLSPAAQQQIWIRHVSQRRKRLLEGT